MKLGEFLCEKLKNMAAWVEREGGPKVEVPITAMQATAVAITLHEEYSSMIANRDVQLFEVLAQTPQIPKDLVMFIVENDHLHDKFWRYLALFSEAVSSTDGAEGPANA